MPVGSMCDASHFDDFFGFLRPTPVVVFALLLDDGSGESRARMTMGGLFYASRPARNPEGLNALG